MPEKGTVNRFGETWDGARWIPGGGGTGTAPLGLNLGPRQPTPGPWDASNTKTMNELLKQMFTIGGATAGSYLGPGGTIGGGAIGRNVGSIPERLMAAAEGHPAESSVLTDTPVGAMEGGFMEALPAVLHPTLKYGGAFTRWLGSRLGRNWATGTIGVPLDVAGEVAEMAADKMGPGSLSTRMRASAEPSVPVGRPPGPVEPPTGPRTRWLGSKEVPGSEYDPQFGPRLTVTETPTPPPASPPSPLATQTGTSFTPAEMPRPVVKAPSTPLDDLLQQPSSLYTPEPMIVGGPPRPPVEATMPLKTRAQQDAAAELARRLRTPTSTKGSTKVTPKAKRGPGGRFGQDEPWTPYQGEK